MKILALYKLFFVGFIYLLNMPIVNAQMTLKEISLEQQIEKSSLVVEGEVISKTSYWSEDYSHIYTVNTVKVFKVFKGEVYSEIKIVTPGGLINGKAQIVRPSLQLRIQDIGVFTLNDDFTKLLNVKVNTKLFKTYSSLQGFYKYDLIKNVVINPFSKRNNIESSLYADILKYTKTDYIEMNTFNVVLEHAAKSSHNKGVLIPSNINFSPSEISAGTASLLTITGSDFGGTKGKVSFKNSEDGGATYIEALDSQVKTWSPTQITVEVPSFAGTGVIMVADSNGDFSESLNELTVSFALVNVTDNNFEYPIQLYGSNGDGGFTWHKNVDFVANADANASFTRALDSWRCETKVNWEIGSDTNTSEAIDDSENIISFGDLPDGTLGVTSTSIGSCNNDTDFIVTSIDIIFDDPSNTTWNYGPGATLFEFDFESVALHELGHGHLLEHVIDDNDVMDFNLGLGQETRALGARNIIAGDHIQEKNTTNIVCSLPLMTNYDCPTNSVEDETLIEAVSIYPNPTTGQFYIQNQVSVNLEKVVVYDASGRLIVNIDLSNTSENTIIDLLGTAKGLYFVNIHSEKGIITRKLMLQ